MQGYRLMKRPAALPPIPGWPETGLPNHDASSLPLVGRARVGVWAPTSVCVAPAPPPPTPPHRKSGATDLRLGKLISGTPEMSGEERRSVLPAPDLRLGKLISGTPGRSGEENRSAPFIRHRR